METGVEIPPPSWSFFRDGFENAGAGRSPAWRTMVTGGDRLSERLGGDWPERTDMKLGRFHGGIALAGSHTVAYSELIELALWLEVLCRYEGFAPVRDALKQDPERAQIPHLRLEFEVGALAAAAGYGVRFERPIPAAQRPLTSQSISIRTSRCSSRRGSYSKTIVQSRSIALPTRHSRHPEHLQPNTEWSAAGT